MGGGIVFYAAVALGIVYLPFVERPPSAVRSVLKTLPVLLLAVFAWQTGGPLLLVLALALSSLGDAFLARSGAQRFIAGLVSFLLAHVAYGLLFAKLGDASLIPAESWRLVALVATAMASAVILGLLWKPAGSMALAVACYCLAIFGMTALSLTMVSPVVFLGALVFVSSDTVLAVRTFVIPPAHRLQKPLGIYVWISYFVAQVVLTLALLAVAG